MKPELAFLIGQRSAQSDLFGLGVTPEVAHDHLVAAYSHLHERMSAAEPEEQARIYVDEFLENPEVLRLRGAFDLWCSIWFWPADRLNIAPTPSRFAAPPEATRAEASRLARELRFFHWEIEFPDVFTGPASGFSAIVGNPPWEIQKPNSKEWFSNHDPLYRAYGKQEALAKQKDFFVADDTVESDWLVYNARLKALSNWTKSAGRPFGDAVDDDGATFSLSRSGKDSADLHERWAARRRCRTGFADPEHPFLHQGSADINTYKMFLELAHALLAGGPQSAGRLGFIVPSGIYTDRGSTDLRTLFLDRCRWDYLFCFENRNQVFDIHRSFKFGPVIIEKGGPHRDDPRGLHASRPRGLGRGRAPHARLPRRPHRAVQPEVQGHSRNPLGEGPLHSREDVRQLRPPSATTAPDGWGIQYTREFDMTNDSKLFPPRPQWEAKGYRPDEYGHWLRGKWRPVDPGSASPGPESAVRSRDGHQVIAVENIEDAALPLYQGVMVGQFDPSKANWLSGTGLNAKWQQLDWDGKFFGPQFLMSLENYMGKTKGMKGLKSGFRDIARTTDQRTMISCLVPDLPCGNKVPMLQPGQGDPGTLTANLNSLPFDWIDRVRQGSTSINYYVIDEAPLVAPDRALRLAQVSASLSMGMPAFASAWLALLDSLDEPTQTALLATPWRRLWAMTPHERLRLRCVLDAVAAHLYGLDEDDFRWMLRDCDHPLERATDRAFSRTLDPKGFWRVDKTLHPEFRHTVLAQVAFADLQALIRAKGEDEGLRLFLGSGPDDGWALPETLRLSDYHLGHDARAAKPQPVAAGLGPRFYSWQLTQTAEESWAECRLHAEKIRRIRSIGLPHVAAQSAASPMDAPPAHRRSHPGSATRLVWSDGAAEGDRDGRGRQGFAGSDADRSEETRCAPTLDHGHPRIHALSVGRAGRGQPSSGPEGGIPETPAVSILPPPESHRPSGRSLSRTGGGPCIRSRSGGPPHNQPVAHATAPTTGNGEACSRLATFRRDRAWAWIPVPACGCFRGPAALPRGVPGSHACLPDQV